MDINEILKNNSNQQQQQLKPKFLSKSQREALAVQKRQEEHEFHLNKQKKQLQEREELDRRALGAGRENYMPTKRQRSPSPTPTPSNSNNDNNGISIDDINNLKARYLGQNEKRKRKTKKISDIKRMNFDWDEDEDTGALTTFDNINNINDNKLQSENDNHQQIFVDHLEQRQAKRHGYDSRNWRDKDLNMMNDRDWRIFNEDFNIAVRGGNIPKPLRKWSESKIPLEILDIINEIGYKEPSPIQRQAIPIGLNNRDLIGIAETGSGKTASFVIPMMAYISKLPPFNDQNQHLGPYALILAPTRELAQQIESETKKFANPMNLKCLSIVGGKSVEEQSFNLRTGAEIIIATPGRLKDILERQILVLSQCHYLVLDEADRMVHMGFEADLTYILNQMGSPEDNNRQTFLYSATMPTAVEHIARNYLRKPATVQIGSAGQAVDTVEQQVELIDNENKKTTRLLDVLAAEIYDPPIIIFVNQKKAADVLARELSRHRWPCTTLHSGKNQEQREASLQSLRDGEVSILVATDLAGRGIDVPDVSLVVNYHMSNNIESYVHRIGRTGRAGKRGTALTFVTPSIDDEVMYDLKNELDKSPISTTPRELSQHEYAQRRITKQMKKEAQMEAEEGLA